MVRAYKGEPVKLRALQRRKNVVHVAGKDLNNYIGFPAEAVYAFDEALFSELVQAFNEGDQDRLQSLWATAEPY